MASGTTRVRNSDNKVQICCHAHCLKRDQVLGPARRVQAKTSCNIDALCSYQREHGDARRLVLLELDQLRTRSRNRMLRNATL